MEEIVLTEGLCLQGVESERCTSFSSALAAGKPVFIEAKPTLADGREILDS